MQREDVGDNRCCKCGSGFRLFVAMTGFLKTNSDLDWLIILILFCFLAEGIRDRVA